MQALPYPKLHKHTGQAYVKYQKRTYYFGKFGSVGADQKYWEWRAAQEGITRPVEQVMSPALPEVMVQYLLGTEPNRHQRSQLRVLLKGCTESLAKLPVTKFGPLAYKHLRENLAGTGTNGVTRVNELLRYLQRVFRWMVSEQIVPLEVWQRLKTVDPLKTHPACPLSQRRRPVPAAVVAATLPHLSPHCADMVRLIVATGARPGEILSLRSEEIVKTYQARPGWWFAEKSQHKTSNRGKKRFLEFGPDVQEILLERWPVAGGYFFPILCPRKGLSLYYQPSSLRQHIGHVCKAQQIEPWHPYQIRHLKLTEIAGREGLGVASKTAGHGSTRVTEIYCHEPPRQDDDERRAG
jgi:integrase